VTEWKYRLDVSKLTEKMEKIVKKVDGLNTNKWKTIEFFIRRIGI
jgi:hypothetical protein